MSNKNVILSVVAYCFSMTSCGQSSELNYSSIAFTSFSVGIQELEESGFDPSIDRLIVWSRIGIDDEIIEYFEVEHYSYFSNTEPIEVQMLNSDTDCYVFECKILSDENNVTRIQRNIFRIHNSEVTLIRSIVVEEIKESDTHSKTKVIWSGNTR